MISLVHRQETMSFLGFPIIRYIDVNDPEDILRAIRLCSPDCPISLAPRGVPWLHPGACTPGASSA